MNTDALRFYILHKFIFNEPPNGWTVNALYHELYSIFDELTEKPIRTYLNNLKKFEILDSTTISKVKHYSLNRESLTYSDSLPESVKESEEFLTATLVSLLNHLNIQDLKPIADEIKKRLIYSYGKRWLDINSYASEISWSFVELFDTTLNTLANLKTLSNNKSSIFKVILTNGMSLRFNYEKYVIRDTTMIAVGTDYDTKEYIEIVCNAINEVQILENLRKNRISRQTKDLFTQVAKNIGKPNNSQVENIILTLSPTFFEENRGKSFHLDVEIYEEDNKMCLTHPISSDLINWILGFGASVTVESPALLKQMVSTRISEMSALYS